MSIHLLWLTVPLALAGLIVLPLFVRRLVALHRSSVVLTVPLLPDQEIFLEIAGAFLLNAEGPRFSRAFGGLDFQLVNLSDQTSVPLSYTLFKSSSSGFSRSRLSLRSFELRQPGHFRLVVIGITDPSVADQNSVVVTYDRRGTLVATILVIVFAAIALLGGLVGSILVYSLGR